MKKTKGFTLVEVMVSVFLVTMAIILISGTIINNIALTKSGCRRFRVQTRFDNLKDEMQAGKSDPDSLIAGRHYREDGSFQIRWEVSVRSPWLKEIRMRVGQREYEFSGFFYISEFFQRRRE